MLTRVELVKTSKSKIVEVIFSEQKTVFFILQHVNDLIEARDGDGFADHD